MTKVRIKTKNGTTFERLYHTSHQARIYLKRCGYEDLGGSGRHWIQPETGTWAEIDPRKDTP